MSRLKLVVILIPSSLHAVLTGLILNFPVSSCQMSNDIPCRTGACWQKTGTVLPKPVVKEFHELLNCMKISAESCFLLLVT